ncbi:mannose-1-phosphate guanylyltransferase/mannose-6-phosphate isomerase [Planktomarina temperata]|nr:mannose-1-phosphate guanylyltransferase/mannose-6-phosphate isomerase [Planktomarina temperata]
MISLYPVLLAGGFGSRLWPLSRKSYPKQFSNVIGKTTLFQSSAQRLITSDIIKFSPHIILTNADFRFIISEQLQSVGIDPGPILIEPEAKNTSAAILAASLFAQAKDENAVMLVAPSDHMIPDVRNFHETIKVGLAHVQNRKVVTFGIKPTHPETGYGYIELETDNLDRAGTSELLTFVEKPNLQDAEQMIASGNYLWNSGIYLFRAQDMVDLFQNYSPKSLHLVSEAVRSANPDLGFLRLAAKPWAMLEDISIDYAIMEKAQNLVVVPFNSKWSDLGGWDSVWSESEHDLSGNVTSKSAHAIDCTNSLLRSESSNQQLVGIGLSNIIAIAMNDAVLVAHQERAQDVKKAVEHLKKNNIIQAEIFPKDHRPWGWFESLAIGDFFQVKRICVKPGAALSLQSHQFRSEHWIVVEGDANITIDEEVHTVAEGESVFVPQGAKHRMANSGKTLMVLIEVQIGKYLGEDDIIRYEDIYARN